MVVFGLHSGNYNGVCRSCRNLGVPLCGRSRKNFRCCLHLNRCAVGYQHSGIQQKQKRITPAGIPATLPGSPGGFFYFAFFDGISVAKMHNRYCKGVAYMLQYNCSMGIAPALLRTGAEAPERAKVTTWQLLAGKKHAKPLTHGTHALHILCRKNFRRCLKQKAYTSRTAKSR